MHAKKLVKWGVALTSTLVLGGVVGPEVGQLLGGPSVVYAEEMQSRVAVHAGYYFDGELVFAAFDLEEFWIGPGENKTIAVPVVDGYVYEGKYLLSNRNGERLLQGSPSARYEDTVGSSFVDVILIYAPAEVPVETPTEQPVEQPVETPTEQPVEQPADQPAEKPVATPTEQPAETPTEQPAEQPTEQPATTPTEQPITYRIHYFLNDVVENGGTPSYTDIAPYKEGVISKGETIVEVAPHIDGYTLTTESWSKDSIEVTYEEFTGENVWHDEDWYPTASFFYDKIEVPKPTEKPVEQPTDQPVEKPVENPTEKLAEQPAETPTEKPVGQPAETPAGQPTEQPVEQPAETPTEKPVGQPAETPADQPVEKPVETPTEQPTATSLLAGNTASKAQTGATTDKKKVDNSTPSTNTVKSEEGSQATAKTLPKTGDSSSMLLMLGGLLSGLSGLGLAASSRKRD
ncbi:TPA: LPXTG cell wall anchor domain-containing protein [Streptococcus suis]